MHPELRTDPISGHTVLIAPGRAARPMTLADSEAKHRPPRHRRSESAYCPFCPGNEWDTPSDVMTVPAVGEWQLRIVPNKYPAVSDAGSFSGVHDVVIPCRDHESNLSRLTPDAFSRMIRAWRDRLRVLSQNEALAHATVFMNVGAEAGASLDHLHAQILTLPFVPPAIETELTGHTTWQKQNGHCWFCSRPGQPVVYRSRGFTAICPRASRFASEIWVIPDRHHSHFEDIEDDSFDDLATMLLTVLKAVDATLHEPAFNLFIHTAPFRSTRDYHWHIELIPRTARAAGFEWGAGVMINTTDPETAAHRLRESLDIRSIEMH